MSTDHDFLTSQTVTFADANAGEAIDFGRPPTDVIVDQTMADLGGFLERPTLIKTITWTESAFADQTFDPWTLFLSNAYIKNKLQNFAYLRGNLKIKVVMNAAPFYYGALLFSYLPLQNQAISLGVTSKRLIPLSQRPHMWVFPQTGTAGEMKLPFIWQANYIDLTSAAIVAQLGQFTVTQYSILRSANGATSNGVTLQVYAWMEDHHLVGPTYVAALQGGDDEYGNGPVSAPASAVAHWATYLHNVPIIGSFAKATTIGASAVSKIATIFGWTNVPVIDNVRPLKNVPFHDIASAHISEPTAKFTLDPKAELSVDPLIVGGTSEDELAVSSLVQRESYLASASWPTTDSPGTQYFSILVYPQLLDVSGASPGNSVGIYQTPLAWMCPLFKSWRGDIIFRFKIIASKFHQGRLRISWDPVGTQSTSSDTSNIVYTKIVDISECDEVEFRVPYLQPLPWSNLSKGLSSVTAINFNTNNATSVVATKNVHNGVLSVRCLTNLSAPVDVAPVDILLFVRGAENLEFANPTQLNEYAGASHIAMQSGNESWDSPVKPSAVPDERYLVNYGEAIPSLRILMRRSCHVDTIPFGYQVKTSGADHSADKGGSLFLFKPRFPLPPGYDSQGMFRAKGVEATTTTFQFNYAKMSTLEWISCAFVACRGAVRWHYNFNCPAQLLQDVSVRRLTDTVIGSPYYPQYSTTRLPTDSFSVSGRKLNTLLYQGNAGAGVVVNNLQTQTGISFELPMMTNSRFIVPNPGQWNTPAGDYSLYSDVYLVSAEVKPESYGATALQNLTVSRYASAGTDYTVCFFLNVPPLFYNGNAGTVPDTTDQL